MDQPVFAGGAIVTKEGAESHPINEAGIVEFGESTRRNVLRATQPLGKRASKIVDCGLRSAGKDCSTSSARSADIAPIQIVQSVTAAASAEIHFTCVRLRSGDLGGRLQFWRHWTPI